MAYNVKGAITITLTILLGIGLQVVFALSEMNDNPSKAAVEFTKAYFDHDPEMRERLCADLLESGDGDLVAAYINRNIRQAEERGFSLSFLQDRIRHISTKTLSVDQDRAVLEVEAKLKNSLRSFFTGEEAYEVHEKLRMVKEDGEWKVCGNPFMMAGAGYVAASSAEPEEADVAEEPEAQEETDEDESSEEAEESESADKSDRS